MQYRDLTDEEKSFLSRVGYWSEDNVRAFPDADWYELSYHRYIPMVCAEDWLEFRTIKTGNLVEDLEWWVTKAKAEYGIYSSDLEYIKDQGYTYESAENYPDTVVREFIRWMKEA